MPLPTIELKGKIGKAKVFTDYLEKEVEEQIKRILDHPVSEGVKIRIMPDVHLGKGSVVGFTSTLNKLVIPNIVGVDIGCGVLSVKIEEIPSFEELDKFIRKNIPAGFNVRKTPYKKLKEAANEIGIDFKDFKNKVKEISYRTDQDLERVINSIGTLGGGNHFIEINEGKEHYYLTIHSGSRNFGHEIAKYHQEVAKKLHSESFKDLEYLEGKEAKQYLFDMEVAQNYARLNRWVMAKEILEHFNIEPLEKIESIHNYIDFEDNIVRKGAIRAHKGEKVVIPLNMAKGVVIGEGKGLKDWNFSAPHGAGRKLSRRKAKEILNVEEFKKVMEEHGVWSTSVSKKTLDEAPFAYKEPEKIMPYLKEVIEIKEIAKAIYNFKA